ncbi:MAG: DbpA RNA binding domain-containing protein [Candidatus Ornithospirochaeta sp.]
MENEKKGFDEESLSAKIQEVLAAINSCTEPEEIESIRKLIKKNVPFTRRGYFSAMVLKMMMEKPQRRERRERPERSERFDKAERKPQERKPAPALQEGEGQSAEAPQKVERVMPEDAKTLYLNVGKMKHLYAKNLSILLQKELGITRDDIYSLRVHDKYSFITMSEENCNKAIEKLNGKDINGRTAQINFSTK